MCKPNDLLPIELFLLHYLFEDKRKTVSLQLKHVKHVQMMIIHQLQILLFWQKGLQALSHLFSILFGFTAQLYLAQTNQSFT